MSYSRPFNFLQPIAVSASKTFVLTDIFTLQQCTNSGAITLTVAPDSTVAFDAMASITIQCEGAGTVTIAAGTGVTIRRVGTTATTGHVNVGQYTLMTLWKYAANDWRLYGAAA